MAIGLQVSSLCAPPFPAYHIGISVEVLLSDGELSDASVVSMTDGKQQKTGVTESVVLLVREFLLKRKRP